ncbi:MAG: PepSY-like domain-containing protein [Bacteroidales bacterium]|nr:PepSY-like domain-containing protein [Bacteroidales bacterium]MDE7071907.1 PepSY-like domain-containing protein [Bacteroidales bacterium]
MKKSIFALLFSIAIVWTGKASDVERIISFDKLPELAQSFLQTHFGGLTVAYVKEETELSGVQYEVKYTDRTEVEFNGEGQWKKVERKNAAVPDPIIPEKIRKFLQERHAGNTVKSVEKGRLGYEVELHSGLELKFDAQQNFVRYDD